MGDATVIIAATAPRTRAVPVDRPWTWLAAGWRDLRAAPSFSLTFGLALALASYVLIFGLMLSGRIVLLLPLAAGFAFVAPILAIAFYAISRDIEAGRPLALARIAVAWRHNGLQIAFMGLILMMLHLAWVRFATLLFALFFQDPAPPWEAFLERLLFSSQSLPFLVTGTLTGAVLAGIAFAVSAVAVPMLMDRDVNVVTAIATSVAAVRSNWQAMALWAALIAFFTLLGLATFCVGLALTLPLIGHATWHAYRDLVA